MNINRLLDAIWPGRGNKIRSSVAPGSHGVPRNMQAIIVKKFGPVNSVHVETVPVPRPERDEVLIEVAHAGIELSDRLVIEGASPIKHQLPFCPGEVLAGYVVQVGADVSCIVQGHRAIAHVEYGAWQQFASVPAVDCSLIHDDLLIYEAVALDLTGDYRSRCQGQVDKVRQRLWQLYIDEVLEQPIVEFYDMEEFNLALDRLERENTTGQVLLKFLGTEN